MTKQSTTRSPNNHETSIEDESTQRPPTPKYQTYLVSFENPEAREAILVVAHGCHVTDGDTLVFWSLTWDAEVQAFSQRVVRAFRLWTSLELLKDIPSVSGFAN